jgi:hypothetical protein
MTDDRCVVEDCDARAEYPDGMCRACHEKLLTRDTRRSMAAKKAPYGTPLRAILKMKDPEAK